MDSEQTHDSFPNVPGSGSTGDNRSSRQTPPPPPPGSYPVPVYVPSQTAQVPRKAKGSFFGGVLRFVGMLIFIGSILLNLFLLGMVGDELLGQEVYRAGEGSEMIAIIPVNDVITMETAEEFRRLLLRAKGQQNVRAIILQVNSPGGQVVPSAMMGQYVEEFQEQVGIPVYAGIEQVGASGAYWTCAGAEQIYARTNASVGSIGVIYMNFVVAETLKQKLGIEPVVIISSDSPAKDQGSFWRLPTEQEKVEIQSDIDKIHVRFQDAVRRGRRIDGDKLALASTGEVFDGPEALELGLIDGVGSLDDLIEAVTDELGLVDPPVVRLFEPAGFAETLLSSRAAFKSLDLHAQVEELLTSPRIMALWPGR